MFRFTHPILLVLIIPIAGWLIYALRRKPAALTHSMASKFAGVAGSTSDLLARLPLLIRFACLTLLVITAARPQLYNVSRETKSSGVDIILCLDTSGSMEALDFKLYGQPVTRLTAVKKVVQDFISRREFDRIGLVVFGEDAFTQSPLTMDKGLLLTLVDKMEIGMAGDMTAVGSAVAVSGKRLKDLKAKSKIVILLTDGRHNAGEVTPEQAAEALKALGIKIYTIGVGGKGPAPFRVNTIFGQRLIYQDVDLDEESLQKVASLTGGKYFRASDSKRLAEIYEIIDQAEKTEVKVKEFFNFRELYYYVLIPALVLFVLEIVLSNTVLRVIP